MNLAAPGARHIRADYPADVLDALSGGWEAVTRWWNGVELWLTQLWFPLQVAILMVVLLPLCWLVAAGIDRGVDRASERLGRRPVPAPPLDEPR